MAKIDLIALEKSWETAVAVDGISLTIADGDFVAILGPSGCGKSTTLFMLAGIYLPTSGDILFDDARVNDVEARDRNVGIVFQSYALYPNMSVMQNIQFPLRFKDVAKAEADRRAREVAEMVQINDLLDRRPNQLSGGQQQRVALARALVKRPNLLLLDEPLSNLDATLRLTMRAEIRRITRDLGVTTILVTHDQLEATTMADQVVCMNGGRIEQVGTADDLYHRPDTLFVAGFIGSPPINLVAGKADDGRFSADNVTLEVPGQVGPIVVGIRPESLIASETGIPGRVNHIEPMGRETLMTCDTPFGPLRFLEATSRPKWRENDTVNLSFDRDAAILFDAEGRRLPSAVATLGTTVDA